MKTTSVPSREHIEKLAVTALAGIGMERSIALLRRRIFYNLILAEVHRFDGAALYRQAAMDAAKGDLSEVFAIYMRIVEATTEQYSTAHFGDLNSSNKWSHSAGASSPLIDSLSFHSNFGPAFIAAGLERADIDEYEKFLFTISLEEIIKQHQLQGDDS